MQRLLLRRDHTPMSARFFHARAGPLKVLASVRVQQLLLSKDLKVILMPYYAVVLSDDPGNSTVCLAGLHVQR